MISLFIEAAGSAAAVAGGGGAEAYQGDGIVFLDDDDDRTLASYGIVGDADDGDLLVTLQLVVVVPLTPEQVEARSREVYAASLAGEEERLGAAIEAGGADLNWRNPDFYGYTPVHIAAHLTQNNTSCLSKQRLREAPQDQTPSPAKATPPPSVVGS